MLETGPLRAPKNVRRFRVKTPTLIFFSLPFWKKQGKTHKNSKDSFSQADPQNRWKRSKKRSKKQGFPWKEKSKEIQNGKEKKIREFDKMAPVSQRSVWYV